MINEINIFNNEHINIDANTVSLIPKIPGIRSHKINEYLIDTHGNLHDLKGAKKYCRGNGTEYYHTEFGLVISGHVPKKFTLHDSVFRYIGYICHDSFHESGRYIWFIDISGNLHVLDAITGRESVFGYMSYDILKGSEGHSNKIIGTRIVNTLSGKSLEHEIFYLD